MSGNPEPSLAFISDGGHLKFHEEPIRVHDIIKDIVNVSMLSAGKKVRIAFFYQNDSFDAVIPYCLEMLYQTNITKKQERNHVLLFGGKLYSFFKTSYKDSFYGDGNFCNHLFGLGVVTPKGSIRGEKKMYSHGGKSVKRADDKFLFSSNYSFFPDEEIAKQIAAIVIAPPSITNMYKIPKICKWCEENEVPTISIVEPHPTARKIKYLGDLGFISYGWNLSEIKEAALNAPCEAATPLSNPKRLLLVSDPGKVEYVTLKNSNVSSLFSSLNSTLTEAGKKVKTSFYERDMIMEAASLSRKLAALSAPLSEYDKEYFGSVFRKPLSERVDNFVDIVGTATDAKGVFAEMSKAAHYLTEIKKELSSGNPKFNEMATQIGSLLSSNLKAAILIPTQKEANAFIKALSGLKVPISEYDLHKAGIEIKSFSAEQSQLENSKHDVALLTTYPFLDKKYLLYTSIAKKIKILLYPCEESDFKFYNNLYSEIESKFFTKARREKINSFLSGRAELDDIRLSRIIRDREKAEAKIETDGKRKPKDIITVLTDMEKSLDVSGPSIFQETVSRSAIKREASGKIKTSGLRIYFHSGDSLYVREEKVVQVLTASDDIVFKLAGELKPGETVVLINRDLRVSLNELIFEKAEEYPKLKVLQTMVSLWINTLREGMIDEDHDEDALLRKMNDMGAGIKSKQTVRHWINGEVIGPRDLKNILRIAEIYKSESLKKNAKAVAASITQMRGLRISIFRRAKNALVEGKSEDMDKLGIDLSDFADAIEFFRVASIKKVDGIPVEMLDKIGGGYEI